MKTLIAVRHAKSSWERIDQPDFDRTLNDRGKRDAPEMARRLKEKGLLVDLFVSSPAKRARKPAAFFAAAFNGKKEAIVLADNLYEAAPETFYNVVQNLPDSADTVVLFSHNPGITAFVNSLTSVRTDNMPTCGVFAVQVQTAHWRLFRESEKKFLFYDFPKTGPGHID